MAWSVFKKVMLIAIVAIGAVLSIVSAAPQHPFGSHHGQYANSAIFPSVDTQTTMDSKVLSLYNKYKGAYLKDSCGGYWLEHSSSSTVSEAHGYGMIMTAMMAGSDSNAQSIFNGMHDYYLDHMSGVCNYLMSWKQTNCKDVEGNDSATDGDMDIAYSYLIAHEQWGSNGAVNYLQHYNNIIGAIRNCLVHGNGDYLYIGDWAKSSGTPYSVLARSSDIVPQHLRAFYHYTKDNTWKNLLDNSYDLIASLQDNYASNTGLLPDFITGMPSSPKPVSSTVLEGPTDGMFSWNAFRTPWRIGTDCAMSGDSRCTSAMQKLTTWIKAKSGGNANGIIGSTYKLDGTEYEFGTDKSWQAAFGVAAMTHSSYQSFLNSIWSSVSTNSLDNQFTDAVRLLSMMVMSNNWWTPGQTGTQPGTPEPTQPGTPPSNSTVTCKAVVSYNLHRWWYRMKLRIKGSVLDEIKPHNWAVKAQMSKNTDNLVFVETWNGDGKINKNTMKVTVRDNNDNTALEEAIFFIFDKKRNTDHRVKSVTVRSAGCSYPCRVVRR